MVSVEVYRMISDIIRKERETRAREKGRQEVRDRVNEWYEEQRRNGTTFTSPPPGLEQDKNPT